MRFYPRQESRMIDVFIAKLDMMGRKEDICEKIVEFSFSMASTQKSESNPA